MSDYRRMYEPGGMFFFTVVTHQRRKLFSHNKACSYLHDSIRQVQLKYPFEIVAIVLLPDHLHCIWKLPDSDKNFSSRWACIKKEFSKLWIASGGSETEISEARRNHREAGVWQRRFWEHRIKNEDDFINHINYIHYNPVKHGMVHCPHQWEHSSFHRWVKDEYYKLNWLCDCEQHGLKQPDFALITTTGE
jgi:putative transposase